WMRDILDEIDELALFPERRLGDRRDGFSIRRIIGESPPGNLSVGLFRPYSGSKHFLEVPMLSMAARLFKNKDTAAAIDGERGDIVPLYKARISDLGPGD